MAVPAHLHALRDFVPDLAVLAFAIVRLVLEGGEVRAEGAGGASGGGVLEIGLDHAGADAHGIAALGRRQADEVVPGDEARVETLVEEGGDGELGLGALDAGEVLEGGQLDEDEGHALDDAEDGGRGLGLADDGVCGQAAEVRGEDVAEALRVQADVVRNGGVDEAGLRLGDGDGAGLGDEGVNAGGEEGHGGADGRVAGEGDLGVGQEDVDVALGGAGRVAVLVHEDGLAQVELARDGLLLLLRRVGRRTVGDGDDGEGVALKALGGEDVEGDEGEVLRHRGRRLAKIVTFFCNNTTQQKKKKKI